MRYFCNRPQLPLLLVLLPELSLGAVLDHDLCHLCFVIDQSIHLTLGLTHLVVDDLRSLDVGLNQLADLFEVFTTCHLLR